MRKNKKNVYSVRAAALCALLGSTAINIYPTAAYAEDAATEDRGMAALASITYNFARFIQWRGERAATPHENFVLCIIDDRVSPAWSALEGKAVGDRAVALAYPTNVESAGRDCDMAYVGVARQKDFPLRDLSKSGVVTVSDSTKFTDIGGAIGFTVADNRATFVINEQVMARAGARVSSKLMRVGMRVSVGGK